MSFVNPLTTPPTPSQVSRRGGDRIPTLTAVAVDPTDDPDTVLVTLAGGGDMSTYTLSLATGPRDPTPPPWVDPILAAGCFTFALDCLTDVACDDDTPCPPAAVVEPILDYLARDWTSLRAVLLDRLAVLQPGWTQRDVADVRVALVELLGRNRRPRELPAGRHRHRGLPGHRPPRGSRSAGTPGWSTTR